MLPPTVQIEHDWWEPNQRQVLQEADAGTAILEIGARDTAIPKNVTAEYQGILTLIIIVPLTFISPFIKSPFMAPPAAYLFIKVRLAAVDLTT